MKFLSQSNYNKKEINNFWVRIIFAYVIFIWDSPFFDFRSLCIILNGASLWR